MRKKHFAWCIVIFATGLLLVAPISSHAQESQCNYSYVVRGLTATATITHSDGTHTSSSSTGGSGGTWYFQCGNTVSANVALKQCVDHYLAEEGGDENYAKRRCSCTGCETLKKGTARPQNTTSNQQEVYPNKNIPDNDSDEQERANERTRLFNQQKGKTTVVNPDSSTSEPLVRQPGESEDRFQARQRATMYEDYKRKSAAFSVNPDGSINGSKNDSAWTDEDGKKYTQGKKGHWVVGSFRAAAWGSDRMLRITGGVTAWVVNEKGEGAFKGTFLEIRNPTSYPIYYGLSGVFNKKLEPGETYTEDLHMYRAIDPARRAKEPDTVVTIMVKYWVENP